VSSVYDVAQAIVDDLDGRYEKKKLQKLLYYVQGWYVTWNDGPLFEDDLQAWKMGPVVYDVWKHFMARPLHPEGVGNADNLTSAQRAHVRMVVDRYGMYSGAELERRAHHEDPWQDARGDLPLSANSSLPISKGSLRAWFSSESFTPETEEDEIDESLVVAVLEGAPGAFGDLIESATGVRPIDQ